MHGMTNGGDWSETAESRFAAARAWLHEHRLWFLIVLLPTILVAIYYLGFAAPQYEAEAHFMVRTAEPEQRETGLGQALSLVGAGPGTSQSDAMSVGDYLSSHDAVAALKRSADLTQRFDRPEADVFSRLGSGSSDEALLRFYRKQVDVHFDTDTGITTLRVRSFRPDDSYLIINKLLQLGEQRVNALNIRAYQSTLGVARSQLAGAEQAMTQAQGALTAYRRGQQDIDPEVTGKTQIALVSQLQGLLAETVSQEQAMAGALASNSPQLVAMRAQVRALQAQVASASGKLTSGTRNIATGLGHYQELELRQQFAAKLYDTAAAGLERAREQAFKQQLFVVRVVEPNMPEQSQYPKPFKIILTVFVGLLLAYGIGWLIAAGMREHAA